jgi:hypothetical protein
LSFAASAFEPGMKSITIYTVLKSKAGSDHLSLLLDNQTFEKLLANKDIVKGPMQLQNTYDFLNLLDSQCDVQLKCTRKVEGCDEGKTCKACPSCKLCNNCDKCTTLTPTTTKPPRKGKPYIPSKAPPRSTYLPPTTVSYGPARFSPIRWNYNFKTGGNWTGQVDISYLLLWKRVNF